MQDAKVQHQELLETLFNKNQLIPRLRKEFSDFGEVDIRAYLKHCEIPYAFGIDVLVHMACQIKGADADGWFRTDGDDWPEHVDAAERAYKWALSEAPQPAEPSGSPTLHKADSGAQNGIQATQQERGELT